ncbi:hypothetical protein BH762_gp117 [Gordonia phage OneUp]|uniref:Uncharacterized protein n=1 Tax=Gordonia phage OneUp TaxID=1838074 RepID=A0A160DEX2_9CAUD|nr:hypothetical protein BH762_gp117 [Gordonia phage OneUp]ANA86402.1 hypothetical protein PBI_ONEUP_67 [Gordonia phage OneUp]
MSYKVTLRDRLAWRLANWALVVATPEYRLWISTLNRLGFEELLRRDLDVELHESGS